MRHLQAPENSGPDLIEKQCSKSPWNDYRERWLSAANAYREAGGNPWKVIPAKFTAAEKKLLYNLYDNRRSGGPIRRIRRPSGGFPSCPMCGSSGGRSLDHALPRAIYPEFSIVPENLVPACTICNSDEKGSEFKGHASPERMIHPYYDIWASAPIWQVEFGADLEAVAFQAVPTPGLPEAQISIIKFHLSNVLGTEWEESSRRFWGSLPQLIRRRLGPSITQGRIKDELEFRLEDEIFEKGVNSWVPAFLRGLLNDPRIPKHLADRIDCLPAEPSSSRR